MPPLTGLDPRRTRIHQLKLVAKKYRRHRLIYDTESPVCTCEQSQIRSNPIIKPIYG